MAKITYKYRSNRNRQNFLLTLRFDDCRREARTRQMVTRENYQKYIDIINMTDNQIRYKLQRNKSFKNTLATINDYRSKLDPLTDFVYDRFNEIDSGECTNEWLRGVLNEYYALGQTDPKRLNITYWINYKIDNRHLFPNKQTGRPISDGRIKHFQTLLSRVNLFESEDLSRSWKVKEFDQNMVDRFVEFMRNDGLFGTTITKTIIDLKHICRIASSPRHGNLDINNKFEQIEIPPSRAKADDEDVIYLTEDELIRIKELDLKSDYLINARKWLMIGCYTGQRGRDLLDKVLNNIDSSDGIIRITQGKTGTKVALPVFDSIKPFIKNKPHKISMQRLSDYIKELGRHAKIDQIISDKKKEFIRTDILKDGCERKKYRYVKRKRKKYEYLATHTCRRTFCMMCYNNDVPLSAIMAMSGHRSESSLLKYINKSNEDHLKYVQGLFNE